MKLNSTKLKDIIREEIKLLSESAIQTLYSARQTMQPKIDKLEDELDKVKTEYMKVRKRESLKLAKELEKELKDRGLSPKRVDSDSGHTASYVDFGGEHKYIIRYTENPPIVQRRGTRPADGIPFKHSDKISVVADIIKTEVSK